VGPIDRDPVAKPRRLLLHGEFVGSDACHRRE
jgi:hypothetical protein